MLVDIIQVCHILKALIYIEKPVAFHRRICVKQRKCLCLPACGNPACANVIFQGKILTAVQIRACLYTDLTPAGISVQKVHKTIHQKTGSNRQKQYYKQDAPSDIFSESQTFCTGFGSRLFGSFTVLPILLLLFPFIFFFAVIYCPKKHISRQVKSERNSSHASLL